MIDIAMYCARIGTFQVPHSKMKKKKGDDKAKLSGGKHICHVLPATS